MPDAPEPVRERTTPITPDDHPEGCFVLQLVPVAEGPRDTVIGRHVVSELPCPKTDDPCGDRTADLYRYPTTGLNVPGEPSPVGELRWCSRCGTVALQLVPATEQERAWDWDLPSRL